MATFPQDPTFGDLNEVARQSLAFGSLATATSRAVPESAARDVPAAEMASSSPIGSAMKQILPNRAGDTEIGRIVASVFPEELKRKIENIELGGMSAQEKQDLSKVRAEDIDLRRSTFELGKVPVGTKGQEGHLVLVITEQRLLKRQGSSG